MSSTPSLSPNKQASIVMDHHDAFGWIFYLLFLKKSSVVSNSFQVTLIIKNLS
jgi:hypothetical protein